MLLNVGESQSILIWVRVKNDTILLIAFWLESELKMKWFCRFCWFSRFGWFCCDDSVYFADFQKTWCLTFFPSKYFNSQHFPNRLVEALSARYDIWTGIFFAPRVPSTPLWPRQILKKLGFRQTFRPSRLGQNPNLWRRKIVLWCPNFSQQKKIS